MPRTSRISGPVWRATLFREPPPHIKTADEPAGVEKARAKGGDSVAGNQGVPRRGTAALHGGAGDEGSAVVVVGRGVTARNRDGGLGGEGGRRVPGPGRRERSGKGHADG